jgi:hypothetical protein
MGDVAFQRGGIRSGVCTMAPARRRSAGQRLGGPEVSLCEHPTDAGPGNPAKRTQHSVANGSARQVIAGPAISLSDSRRIGCGRRQRGRYCRAVAYFDSQGYYEALDAERARRGLTWAGVARELNAPFAHRPDIPPISVSTITGVRGRTSLNGNIVVHTLMWLGRSPEEFIADHPVEPAALPRLKMGCLPRWDTEKLYAAIDEQLAALGLSWARAALEVGDFTPTTLKAVRKAVSFPRAMRLLAWLRRPAADFVTNEPV